MCRRLILLVLLVLPAGWAGSVGAQSLVKIDPATVTNGNVYLMNNVGANVPDDSANNNTGVLVGSPTPVTGLNGGALQFNGSSDGVTLPNAATINTSTHQNKTVIAVFNCPDVSKSGRQVIYDEGGATRGLNIYVEQGQVFVGGWDRSDYTPQWAGTFLSAPIGSEEWHAVALVLRNGTAAQEPDKFEMWLDGKLIGRGPGGELRSRTNANGVGYHNAETRFPNGTSTTTGDYFAGIIDELWILNSALTDAELSALRIPKSSTAFSPKPGNGDVYDNDWASLTWKPGGFAVSHDVYFGTSFDDVNDGAASSFRGNVTVPFFLVGTPGVPNSPDNLVPGRTYYWRIDEVNDANDASPWQGEVWSFHVRPVKAWSPVPADGTAYVDPDQELGWDFGLGAVFHTVFFGTSVEEVTNATAGTMTADPTYDPGTLQPGTTYYWRVDELAFPANATNTGDVWSFTTVPDFPVNDPSLMVWWRLDENTGTRAIDWSGHGRHGDFQSRPLWVQGYDGAALNFDRIDDGVVVRFADEIWPSYTLAVWAQADVLGQANNSAICATYGTATTNGFQISFDTANNYQYHAGVDQIIGPASLGWVHLAVVYDGTAATAYYNGAPVATFTPPPQDLTHNKFAIGVNRVEDTRFDGTIDDFRVYDRALTPEEIELVMRIDPLRAWQPNPADASEADIRTALPLTWTQGDDASRHDVYFGTDAAAVAVADTSDPTGIYRSRIDTTSFTPAEDLDWGRTYFWRVDEINTDGSVTTGKVWSFTVPDYLIVDNFESYTDQPGEEIFSTWIDGFTNALSGSTVGYFTAANGTFGETAIVHGGGQSMPFDYNNTESPWYSEAEREFTPAQNFSFGGADTLVVSFQGAPVDFLESAGTITLSAAGADIWNTADEFRYAYQRLTGDGSILARVDSITNTNVWAKGGVMIRETLDPSSRHAMVVVTPGSGVAFQRRLIQNDVSVGTTQAGITAPHWVKLTRTGNTLTAQHSADGVTWTDVVGAAGTTTSDTVVMGGTIYIGLALTSHAANVACTAVFSNLATTGNVTGSWQQAEIGVDHPANSAQGLYVGIEDSGGKAAFVTHPDPAASTIATWTDWAIPLSDFAGVNLTRVKKLYLGVGDRQSPVPDGAGRLYFDDIRVVRGMPAQPTATP